MLSWLANELQEAEDAGQRAWISTWFYSGQSWQAAE